MRQGSRQVRHPVTFAGAVGGRPEKTVTLLEAALFSRSSLVPTSTWPKAAKASTTLDVYADLFDEDLDGVCGPVGHGDQISCGRTADGPESIVID